MKRLLAIQTLVLLASRRASAQSGSDCIASTDTCTPFSSEFGSGTSISSEVVIPCGKCVSMGEFSDGSTSLTLSGGLTVVGTLYFPPLTEMSIATSFLKVSGSLVMSSKTKVDGSPGVVLTNEDGVEISSTGSMSVSALPETCPTMVKMKSSTRGGLPVPDASSYPQAHVPAAGCSNTVIGSSELSKWRTSLGAVSTVETLDDGTQYLKITKRQRKWQGVTMPLDITGLSSCLVADKTFLLRASIMLNRTDGVRTRCDAYDRDCPSAIVGSTDSSGAAAYRVLGETPGGAYNGDGEWFDFTTPIMFTASELSSENIHTELFLSGPETGVDMSIGSIVLEAPSASAFPSSTSVCNELIANGDASASDFHSYPWLPIGPRATHVGIGNDGGNPYFEVTGRRNVQYATLQTDIVTACAEEHSVYEFSARVRVGSVDEVTMSVLLKTTDPSLDVAVSTDIIASCPPSSSEIGWVSCSANYAFEAKHANAKELQILFVTDGDVESDFHVDDVSFVNKLRPVTAVSVDASVAECWDSGAEILFSSPSLDASDSVVNKISAISSDGSTAVITLENNLQAFTSLEDSADSAIEVALLSREIVFRGGFVSVAAGAEASIRGAEFEGMGVSGAYGQYPLHVSGGTTKSLISQNTIRNSLNRCIVLSSTIGATVSSNVAYNTVGHCYYVDKLSKSNTLSKNFGADTKSASLLASILDSDDTPATFWTANPANFFDDNVAAGSDEAGFWFQIDEDEESTLLGSFSGNVMHSNQGDGLKLYPNGYLPGSQATFENVKSYRNKGYGVILHSCENVQINQGYFADNRIGVSIRNADGITLSNVKIIGLSDVYGNLAEKLGMSSHCPAYRPMVGLRLHSYTRFPHVSGSSIDSVTIENVTPETTGGCFGSVPVVMDSIGSYYNDASITLQGVSVVPSLTDPSVGFNACGLAGAKVKDLAINDASGSFDPSGAGAPGFIVSDSYEMKRFVGDACTPMPESCTLYCAGITFEPLVIAVSAAADYETVSLQVYLGELVQSYKPYFDLRTVTDQNGRTTPDDYENYGFQRRRFFQPMLPSGKEYVFRFRGSDGKFVWPRFTEYNKETTLSWSFTFDTPLPTSECTTEAIANSKPDKTTWLNHWSHTGGGITGLRPGFNSVYAPMTNGRAGGWQGVGQYLDSRCFSAGMELELTARFKMVDQTTQELLECNPSQSEYLAADSCPRVSIILRKVRDTVETTYLYPAASAKHPFTEWGILHGVFTFSADMEEADSIYVFLEGGRSDADIALADLSVAPKILTCTDSSFNRNLELGNTYYWDTNGKALTQRIQGQSSRWAIGTTYRDTYFSSMSQVIFPDCLSEGVTYAPSAFVRLLRDGSPFTCNPSLSWDTAGDLSSVCPVMSLKVYKDGVSSVIDVAKFESFTAGSWNQMKGTFTATTEMATADRIVVFWQKVVKEVEIQVDNFSLETIQPEGCHTLIYHNDFDQSGRGSWRQLGGGSMDIGAPGDGSDLALHYTGRTNFDDGFMYPLNRECIPRRSVHKIAAKVKMVKPDGSPVSCNKAKTRPTADEGEQRCPQAAIVAQAPGSMAQERIVGGPIANWVGTDFNSLVGYFYWDPNEWSADTLYLSISGAPANVNLVIDNVYMTREPFMKVVDTLSGRMVNITEFHTVLTGVEDVGTRVAIFNMLDVNQDGLVDAGYSNQCYKEIMTMSNVGIDGCFYVAIPGGEMFKGGGDWVPPKVETLLQDVTGMTIYITQSDSIESSAVTGEGFISNVISAGDAVKFNLGDEDLKTIVSGYFGQEPTSVHLSSPTGDPDLYLANGWKEVELNVAFMSASIDDVSSEVVVLGTDSWTNGEGEAYDYSGQMTYDFKLSTSHDWGGFSTSGNGAINYVIQLTGSEVASAGELTFGLPPGDAATGGVISNMINVTSTTPMSVNPGQTVYTQLSAKKTSMSVTINWSAHLSGRAALSYATGMNGYNDWGVWLPTLMNSRLGSTYIGCYHERSVKEFNTYVTDNLSRDACAAQCGKHGYRYFARRENNLCHCNDSYGLYLPSDKCTCDQEGDLGPSNCIYEIGEGVAPSAMTLTETVELEYYTDAQVKICATRAECQG